MAVSFLRRFDPDAILWAASVSLALAVGILSGLVASFAARDARPVAVRAGSGAAAAAVTLEGFRDGLLRGRAAGPVRLFAGESPVALEHDGSFSLDHPGFHVNDVTVHVPPGMAFVASKKGKKYYSVASAAGERIAPANRVYFRDAASAEAAGFSR